MLSKHSISLDDQIHNYYDRSQIGKANSDILCSFPQHGQIYTKMYRP